MKSELENLTLEIAPSVPPVDASQRPQGFLTIAEYLIGGWGTFNSSLQDAPRSELNVGWTATKRFLRSRGGDLPITLVHVAYLGWWLPGCHHPDGVILGSFHQCRGSGVQDCLAGFASLRLFYLARCAVGLSPDPWDLGLRWNRKDRTSDGGIRKQAPPLVRILPTRGCDLH